MLVLGCFTLIHIPQQHRVIMFVEPIRKGKEISKQDFADCLLLFMYYFYGKVEMLEGEGKQAEIVIDQMGKASLSISDITTHVGV